MIRPSLCLLGPLDGQVLTGPDNVRLATVSKSPISLFPDDPAVAQDIAYVLYARHTLAAGGQEFDFYIPTDRTLADAFAALYDGYKPKETR
jgi:hypothetical protein